MSPEILTALAGVGKGVSEFGNTVLGGVFNALNYKQQKEQFNYMKQMQQQSWLREDNAVQRRLADLKAAGLSPVLAAGSAASSSAPIQVTAPQHQGFEVGNLADAVNMAVGVKQAIVNMRKTIAEEQRTLAETVGTNINNQILEVAKENAQVKFDLQKMQSAEISRRLGLIDAQTAQAVQDTAFKEIQTRIYNRDFDIYNQNFVKLPMAHGTGGALSDVARFGTFMDNAIQDMAGEFLKRQRKEEPQGPGKGYRRMFGGKR